jgi:hypothetical protein
MAANLESATGKSVAAWVGEVRAADPGGFAEIVDWLKTSHGLGHFQARLVAAAHRDASA